MNKFQRPAPARPAAATPARRSKYAGIQAAQPRDPMPAEGMYRFRVLSVDEGHNPKTGNDSFKTRLEIIELDEHAAQHHREGDVVFMGWITSGKGGASGLSRVKSFVMAAAGYTDESAYDAYDPDGGFIEACLGAANEYAERGETILGAEVLCRVTRGNPTPDGADYYRECDWSPAEGD